MPKCASCGAETAAGGLCARCSEAAATRTLAASPELSSRDLRSSSTPASQGRFHPGALLAGRYRIVSLLGRGGMGEVYRAEDLMLGQQVALKFLPSSIGANAAAAERFRNEVRIARQVSHANVCRVYDIGEIEGQLFLSMEYVDGEDLGSLLRRIGRLPSDKALEIARKLCAGLAAAHEKGVLHRDLKPGNIMLDARGQVVLTDFGLAALAGQVQGAEVRSGTPAYMAPEQLAGEEVTVRSDIYSLGLVLYEVFTGKPPFESNTLAEVERARRSSVPASPSMLVKDLDPVVERVILRCLDPKPQNRPPSALAVAAALPGGDPLAAALAAGETPSPEMVAAAGEGVGLSPRTAIAIFASFIVLATAAALIAYRRSAIEMMHLEYSPEVLRQKAREMIRAFGHTAPPADSASGFEWQGQVSDYITKNDKPRPRWEEVVTQRPSLMRFWYRQSPAPLTAGEVHDDLLTPGIVVIGDPPPLLSGMVFVALDVRGRLIEFRAMPPEREAPPKQVSPPDWTPLFTAAGIDPAQLQPAEPEWAWLEAADTRAAWTGKWPGSGRPLRVEAAAWRGKPVAFVLMGPWTKPHRISDGGSSAGERFTFVFLAALSIVISVGGGLLARRNLIRGRGDWRGATTLAFITLFLHMALWVFRGHMTASAGTFGMFLLAICYAVFYAVVLWTMYVALEPFVRRHWPRTLISWTSALSGKWRDAVVGRDVLIGCLFGGILIAISRGIDYGIALREGGQPDPVPMEYLLGMRPMIGEWLRQAPHALRDSLMFLFLLFLFRAIFRNQWLAGALFAALFSTLGLVTASHPVITGIASLVVYGMMAFLLLRFGLLALAAMILVSNTLGSAPVTLDASAWYFPGMLFLYGVVALLSAWAFHVSMAGQRLWKRDLFE